MNDLFAAHDQSEPPPQFREAEIIDWLRLSRSENVGPATFYKLIERFGTAKKALDHLPEMARRGGRVKQLQTCTHEDASREYERVQSFGAQILCAGDVRYPLPLAAISDAPPVLTVKGRVEMFDHQAVGMVGARNASLQGRNFARTLAAELGGQEQVVASGLARGIDTAAHEGALKTGTIAVVAGGIDVVYPPENRKLYDEICDQGLVVAESPFGQKPYAQSFPKRNRIIAALSAGVIVVEASLRSGSLITARLAGEQGRDVFAVPGFPADPRAQGPNKLIRDGAVLIQSAEDVMEYLNSFMPSTPRAFREVPSEEDVFIFEEDETLTQDAGGEILARLSKMPVQVDTLFRDCGLSAAAGHSALLDLELAGRIRRSAGGMVSLT